ncbi:hypothetical protein [Conexibacter arvalis]|uniref:Uncharacterized protein n=1 Tax=Conexibacter arvalis TaxID=912552 RepID=A0A840IG35_9ACTN|nr:hypothetical protein [Conexibacter arvalis]MBB4663163.1 hypothetical protein [Conexibacter arvalis]
MQQQERPEAVNAASVAFADLIRQKARRGRISFTAEPPAQPSGGVALLADLQAARQSGDRVRIAAAEAAVDVAVEEACEKVRESAARQQQRSTTRQPIWPAGAQAPEPPDEFAQFEQLLRRKIGRVA